MRWFYTPLICIVKEKNIIILKNEMHRICATAYTMLLYFTITAIHRWQYIYSECSIVHTDLRL